MLGGIQSFHFFFRWANDMLRSPTQRSTAATSGAPRAAAPAVDFDLDSAQLATSRWWTVIRCGEARGALGLIVLHGTVIDICGAVAIGLTAAPTSSSCVAASRTLLPTLSVLFACAALLHSGSAIAAALFAYHRVYPSLLALAAGDASGGRFTRGAQLQHRRVAADDDDDAEMFRADPRRNAALGIAPAPDDPDRVVIVDPPSRGDLGATRPPADDRAAAATTVRGGAAASSVAPLPLRRPPVFGNGSSAALNPMWPAMAWYPTATLLFACALTSVALSLVLALLVVSSEVQRVRSSPNPSVTLYVCAWYAAVAVLCLTLATSVLLVALFVRWNRRARRFRGVVGSIFVNG